MPISLALLYFFGGSVYLIMGGDLLVRGAIALSRRLGISAMVVGLTVVALGTSAPELVVSVRAALTGVPEVAVGNVVGSNIANVLLVVGLPALIYPLMANQSGVARDAAVMVLASVMFTVLCMFGPLDRVDGALLLVGFGLFVLYVLRGSAVRRSWAAQSEELPRILGLPAKPIMIGTFILLGALWLPVGAELLLRGGVGLAERLGVPNSVVGLTMVALSTSLPELTTSVIAALKHQSDVAVGNVLGSNIFNLLAIMGVTAVVSPAPLPVPREFLTFDLPVMLASALVLSLLIWRRGRVARPMGGALTAGYGLFLVALVLMLGL